jgi:methylenetetrahydrofolate reductase (NADPH)
MSRDDPSLPVRERVAALAGGASYEVSARDRQGVDAAARLLPPGTQVSITWLPADKDDDRVVAARLLRDLGFVPIPHIAARMVESGAHLQRLLGRLCGEAGVDQLLVISGDVKTATGPFADSKALIVSPEFANPVLRHIWLGGYPEGHPKVDTPTLERTLDAKIAAVEALGMTAGVMTQFCFDAAPILDWAQRFRARHRVPVRIGLAGPAGIATLLRYARICGVGTSAKAIVTRGASITRLLTDAAPDPIIRDIATAPAFDAIEPFGLHMFPFGGMERTARWVSAVAAGRFRLHDSESGFRTDLAPA